MKKNVLIGVIVVLLLIIGYMYFSDSSTKTEEEVVSAPAMYSLTITNLSDSQPLSPGAFAIHKKEVDLNYEGKISPESFEPLAEYGSNEAFKNFLASNAGVIEVLAIDAPILPGESRTVTFEAKGDDLYLSGIQMAVGSNDGYALIDMVKLDGSDKNVTARNYDNGTEENQDLLSGFDGGQPDPSQGALNIENGVSTEPQAKVTPHTQLTEAILEIELKMQK